MRILNLRQHRPQFLVGLAVAIFVMIGTAIKEVASSLLTPFNSMLNPSVWGYLTAVLLLLIFWVYAAKDDKKKKEK